MMPQAKLTIFCVIRVKSHSYPDRKNQCCYADRLNPIHSIVKEEKKKKRKQKMRVTNVSNPLPPFIFSSPSGRSQSCPSLTHWLV